VRSSPTRPTPSIIAYALDADSTNAWLVGRGTGGLLGTGQDEATERVPAWLVAAFGGRSTTYRSAARVAVDAPTATVLSDSTAGPVRQLLLRVHAAPGTEVISMRGNDMKVLGSSVDGRNIATARYRGGVRQWSLDYSGPPDSGVTIGLTIPAGAVAALDISARSRGLPALEGVTFPARRPDVVTAQTGDVTVVRRSVRIP